MSSSSLPSLVDRIARNYRREVATLRSAFFDDAGDFTAGQNVAGWRPPAVNISSLTDRFTTLSVIVSYLDLRQIVPDGVPIEAGSRDMHLSVGARHKRIPATGLPVPKAEADAWAIAVFGPWAENVYGLGTPVRLSSRPAAQHYSLYLDPRHKPLSPPEGIPFPHTPLIARSGRAG